MPIKINIILLKEKAELLKLSQELLFMWIISIDICGIDDR